MLKPIAYAVWHHEETRNVMFKHMLVKDDIRDVHSYCSWLSRQTPNSMSLTNLARLPIYLHTLWTNDRIPTRRSFK